MMKKYLCAFIILFLFTGPAAASDAKSVVSQFISDDILIRPIIYSNAKSFRKYFTADLRRVFDETLKQEAISIKATLTGDKPCYPDAEVFFSNAEGVSTFKIVNYMDINGEKYVDAELVYYLNENSSENDYPLNSWTAKFAMKKEKGGWLIDDIYDSKNEKAFKQVLTDGLKSGCYVPKKK